MHKPRISLVIHFLNVEHKVLTWPFFFLYKPDKKSTAGTIMNKWPETHPMYLHAHPKTRGGGEYNLYQNMVLVMYNITRMRKSECHVCGKWEFLILKTILKNNSRRDHEINWNQIMFIVVPTWAKQIQYTCKLVHWHKHRWIHCNKY